MDMPLCEELKVENPIAQPLKEDGFLLAHDIYQDR